MKKKTRITSQTWQRLLIIGAYKEFLQEWLQLYDSYQAINPPIEKELESKCLFELVNGIINKYLTFLESKNMSMSDAYMMLHNYITRISQHA